MAESNREIAERVWRALLPSDNVFVELHKGCKMDKPDDCSLFVEILRALDAFAEEPAPDLRTGPDPKDWRE